MPRIVIAETATAVAVCTDYIAKAGAPSKCSPGPGRVRSAWSTKGYARADLKITDDDYIGLLGPAKGPLLRLELYINQGPTRLIEIVAE